MQFNKFWHWQKLEAAELAIVCEPPPLDLHEESGTYVIDDTGGNT